MARSRNVIYRNPFRVRGRSSMNARSKVLVRLFTTLCVLLAVGCAAEVAPEQDDVAVTSEPLVSTDCSGANISKLVSEGGTVELNCGDTPVTIQVPSTTVNFPTALRSVGLGAITFTHSGTLFRIPKAVSFEVTGIGFRP